MNSANFAGNIGKDCRVNTVNGNNGQITVANFPLAVDKKRKDQNGERMTLWVDCAIWGKRAEALQQYLTKGQKVSVTGTVDVDSFSKDDGTVIPKMMMMVNDITLQGSANNNVGQNNQQHAQPTQQNRQPQNQPVNAPNQSNQPANGGDFDFDDDIPF